jgi:tetratricopeptide (TPR) repeat protein
MAKRRLNKKVALAGSVVIIFLPLVVIGMILYLGQDPEEYIKDGDVALEAARATTDELIKEENYDKAARSFRGAYSRAKTDSLREEVLLKLLDVYIETDDWPSILGCWDEMIKVNPENVGARYGRLKYFYILSDSGGSGAWQEVYEQTGEFLKVAEDLDLLMEDTAKWEVPIMEQKDTSQQRLGAYLYLLRGIAALQMASLGAVTDIDVYLEQSVEDFKKVQELEPDNIEAYWHLARAAVIKGKIFASRGNFEEKDKAIEQAKSLLEQAVQIANSNSKAHINLLMLKLQLVTSSGSELVKEQIWSLEPEFLSLIDKFNSSADAFAAASNFYTVYSSYSGPKGGAQNLDKAIEAIEKSIELDEENVIYAIKAASLYYREYSVYGQKQAIYKAIEIAKKALALPNAQDAPGPRHRANINNRFMLCAFLANCYIEQILESSGTDSKILLANAEQAVHEIEQIFGSSEEPLVVKWQGMLELAKGNKQDAIRKLLTAYEQMKSLKSPERPWLRDTEFAGLSYTLANIFEGTSETGAVMEFLVSAINSGIDEIKPEASLDFVNIILKFGRWSDALRHINAFEEYYGSNQRSRELRIRTYIGDKQFDEAERELSGMAQDDPNTIRLNLSLVYAKIRQTRMAIAQRMRQENLDPVLRGAESGGAEPDDQQFLKNDLEIYQQLAAELIERLLSIKPDFVEVASVIDICNNYIIQGKSNQAGLLVDKFLEYFPDNGKVLVYSEILSETDPAKISQQKRKEIEEQVLSNIADPLRRSVQLGIFYRRSGELEKATGQLEKVLDAELWKEHKSGSPNYEQMRFALSHLFDIALGTKNWELAEKVIKVARRENIDDCQGLVFTTRLDIAKGEYKDALVKIDECLKQRPVFSYAYMLRGNINAALEDEHAFMGDIRKAASLNPLDGTIAKVFANTLYRRNQNLGDNVSSAQITEARDALEKAIALNPADLDLLGLYAEYIASTEPLKAIAIRQDLQRAQPSIENAVLLGKLATEVAVKENDPERKNALFAVAKSSFEQARQIDPSDKRMLYYYSEYFRARGEDEQAISLLQGSQDETLLWNHYFQSGQYEDAKRALEQSYKSGAKDIAIIRGLLLVAEKINNREDVKKYSEELVSLENTVENNLTQIQAYLRVGLVKEAEYKLQSFQEKYPDEPRILLLQAWLVMRQGQLDKALELVNRSLQNDPDNPVAWRLRGEINSLRTNYDQAINDLGKSKLLSDEPLTRISLAKVYLQVERYEDAITELRSTINTPGVPLEARLLLERIYLQLDRKEMLRKFYEGTLEKFPDSASWLNKAGAFAIKAGEFDKAEQLYKKAFIARRELYLDQSIKNEIEDTLYAAAFDGYLNAQLKGAGLPNTNNWDPKKVDEVIEECRKYEDSPLAPIAYLRMAQAKSILGDREKAVEFCRIAVNKAGTNETLASEVLRRMYLMLGAEEVSKYCEQKLQQNPDSLAAIFTMFDLSRISGEYGKAIEYINRGIKLTEPDSLQRVDYTIKKAEMLILAYEKSSDKSYLGTAITDYESLLSKMPNNTSVLNNLAYVLAEKGERLPEALEYAKRALDAQPNNPGFLDTYAYVLHKNQKDSQAAEYLEAALQQYEQDEIIVPAEVYEHKGMIKEQLGAKAEAIAAYRQSLKLGVDTLSDNAKERINKAIERISQ